jgi:hypothetical protein
MAEADLQRNRPPAGAPSCRSSGSGTRRWMSGAVVLALLGVAVAEARIDYGSVPDLRRQADGQDKFRQRALDLSAGSHDLPPDVTRTRVILAFSGGGAIKDSIFHLFKIALARSAQRLGELVIRLRTRRRLARTRPPPEPSPHAAPARRFTGATRLIRRSNTTSVETTRSGCRHVCRNGPDKRGG